jgi:hypothetical protein
MDHAPQSLCPVLVLGKKNDAAASTLLPMLDELERQHAERRRREDRRTLAFLQRAGGADFRGFPHGTSIVISGARAAASRRPDYWFAVMLNSSGRRYERRSS